jgi:hypothetical protein
VSATWDPFAEPAGPAPAPQQQAQEERTEMARLAQATFASPAGQGFLALLRAELLGQPSYIPGMGFDHVAYIEGQKALLRRIDALITAGG